MLRVVLLISSLLGSFGLQAQSDQATGEHEGISLEQAKQMALANNRTIQALKFELAGLKAQQQGQQSAFYPEIGVAGGYHLEKVEQEREGEPVAFVYGRFNLFNGFRDMYAIDSADLAVKQKRIHYNEQRFDLEIDLERAFDAYLYHKKNLQLTHQAIEINQQHQQAVKKLREAGQVTQTDFMEFEIKQANLRSMLVTLKKHLAALQIEFARLLGVDKDQALAPQGELQHVTLSESLDSVLQKAKDAPQYRRLALEQQQADISNKHWRSQWMPQIDLEARGGMLPLDDRPIEPELRDEPKMEVMVVAKLNLFSGFATKWDRIQSENELKASTSRAEQGYLNVTSELKKLYSDIKHYEEKLELEEKYQAMSSRYYESVLKEYRRGVKNSMDLANAADRLIGASRTVSKLKYRILENIRLIEILLGRTVELDVIDHTS